MAGITGHNGKSGESEELRALPLLGAELGVSEPQRGLGASQLTWLLGR